MASRLAILCPGQSAQHADMFAWARADPKTSTMLDEAQLDTLLGAPLQTILADPALLYANRHAQPLVVAATLAAWQVIRDLLPQPALILGYSIGEVAAYGVAGSLSFSTAIRVAKVRAELMDRCVRSAAPQSLLAISGMHLSAVRELVHQHGLFIAIETAEDSAIIGGLQQSIFNFASALSDSRAKLTHLPVAIASHTPLMQAAVTPFLQELARSGFTAPQIPVISGMSAELVFQKEEAQASLARQMAEKIEWAGCMDACAERGITLALELGPGSDLSRMLQARHPHIQCRSVANFRTSEGLAAWLHANAI